MSSGEYESDSRASSHHTEDSTTCSGGETPVNQTDDWLEVYLAQREAGTGSSTQATGNLGGAGSTSQSVSIDLDSYTRGA
jgi:hypothetical protein